MRFILRVETGVPAAASVTGDAGFWRRDEAVASRMSVASEVARQNRFAMIEGTPAEREEWASTVSLAQCGVAKELFEGRDSVRPVCEAAFQLRTPNQSLEPSRL